MAHQLTMYEEMMLLALHDERGTTPFGSMHGYALAGAILAELLLRGAVELETVKKSRLVVAGGTLTGDALLDDCLARVRTAKRRASAQTWVSRFSQTKDLHRRVAERLRQKGVLRLEEGKFLLVFTRRQYPTVNPAPEKELLERVRHAIESDEPVEPRTAVALSLARATGLLQPHFDKALLKERKARLESLENGEGLMLAGEATRAALEAAAAAIATMAAVTVVTTVASSG